MEFSSPLLEGRLERRYKRFLADVLLADGRRVTAHCPNTGSMLGCAEPGARVWLSDSGNPKRRYPLTWELVEVAGGTAVGIHTGRSNALVEEAIRGGTVAELAGWSEIRREVVSPAGDGSRLDFRLQPEGDGPDWFMEVKNVTAAVGRGVALFPDAVTTRGTRHLQSLMALRAAGHRALLCFCIQRVDVGELRPADAIDPVYGRVLRRAAAEGVELIAYRARVSPAGLQLRERVAVVL